MQQFIKPKNQYQVEYLRTVIENDITFVHGASGTGKSAIAIGLACEKLLNRQIERIIFTRPFVNAGAGLGFLKGDLTEKCEPYFLPALDEFGKYFTPKDLIELRKIKKIMLEPLELMRGSNYYDSVMIMTEAQNATYEQIRMFVTRMGTGSKTIVEGDSKQSDSPTQDFIRFVKHFSSKNIKGISTVELPFESIVRSPIIGRFLIETEDL